MALALSHALDVLRLFLSSSVAALLTNGLDMPDGDLWNWLAFAEPT